jgi:RNA polymerase sigma-70 factor (ECF subfamily)
MHTTSLSLLQRVRDPGDRAAWERFVTLYSPLLIAWAMRAGSSESAAEDTAQEVLLVLMRELLEFRYDTERRNFRGWLKTIDGGTEATIA